MAELICARQRSSSVLNVLLKKEKLIVLPQIFPDVLDWNLLLKWDPSSPLAFQITQQTDRQTVQRTFWLRLLFLSLPLNCVNLPWLKCLSLALGNHIYWDDITRVAWESFFSSTKKLILKNLLLHSKLRSLEKFMGNRRHLSSKQPVTSLLDYNVGLHRISKPVILGAWEEPPIL